MSNATPHLGTPNVLVVDDEPALRYTLRAILEEEGIKTEEAADGLAALERIGRGGIELVLTDLRMPRLDGLELLAKTQKLSNPPRVILITAHGSERIAVQAMKGGAYDYFSKPFDTDEVVRVVRRSLEVIRLAEENSSLRAQLALSKTMVFESEALRRLAAVVERAGSRDITVLITGESGTGKELVARALVKASPRMGKPFVRFNCAALPRDLAEAELFGHSKGAFTGASRARSGLFREADTGTIFLDEVGELDPTIQGSLLRVLQEREVRPVGEDRPVPVDVRIIAATNRNLAKEGELGRFRQDLYYRLGVVVVNVPPLRDRPEDIVPLAEHFVRRYGERFGVGDIRLAASLLERLKSHRWPGNVRELENTIERLVALAPGPFIDEDPFGQEAAVKEEVAIASDERLPAGIGLRERVAAFERSVLESELAACGGNQSAAARRLGISRITFIEKMKRYGLR
ncbi:MAG: sigma-54 dependent transcriptional regulator [Pseudomonadota bacterium]